MRDHINRLSVVLKNMQKKRLLTCNEVEFINDGALRGNEKIVDILLDFFNDNEQQQEVEVLEKQILAFLKQQDNNPEDQPEKQVNQNNDNKKDVIKNPSLVDIIMKKDNTDESKLPEETKNPSQNQNNQNQENKKQPNQLSFGHFFSNKSFNSESSKFVASLSSQKQQALQYLKSILDFKQNIQNKPITKQFFQSLK